MEPSLAFSKLSQSVFVVTRWVKGQEGHIAAQKYDVTESFHAVATELGYVRLPAVSHTPWCTPGGVCDCAIRTSVNTEHLPNCHSITLSEWEPCNCRDA